MKNLKSILFLLLLTLGSAFQGMADAISDFTGAKAINAPAAAVMVTDLRSGKTLASHNECTPLIPASIMKAVTTGTLLQKVGNDFEYETNVYITGTVSDGVLNGDIVVEASGDPSINTRHDPWTHDITDEIVEALADKGIRSVKGRVIVDEKRFPGAAINPTWASGDLPHAYGTGTHGFNFEDNASGSKSVKDPAAVFTTRLKEAMARAGITLEGLTLEHNGRRHLLGHHLSAPVDDIMRSCMMRSDNQFAEGMLRTIGLVYSKEGSTKAGAKAVTDFWRGEGADMEGVTIVDGSGLSRSNRVTARFMTDVLKEMWKNPYYASFFPLAGQEGTLKKFLAGSPLEGYIALKTGSMNGIQCYAGYKLNENYVPTHSVVVIMNEMGNRAAARAEVERMLLALFPEN